MDCSVEYVNQATSNKHCWVCFASEDDDYSAQWVSPCKCKGTAKWVHKSCLQRWIDEKQQGNSTVEVACPQCNNVYVILYPKSSMLVRVLDVIDRIICKSCPFLAGGILVGSVYWTAVTYGAVTIMQVLGHKEGLNVMEKADPLIMLIGLPAIPVMLMLGRLIRWEDAVLKFWRKHSTKFPLFNIIFPNASPQYLPRTPAVAYSSNSDPVSFTRTICGGLILPTIATIVGKLLFQRVNSNFQRSIIGGMAFICLKGVLKIYYKQQQFLRQAHRQIKNYDSSLLISPNSHQIASSSSSSERYNQDQHISILTPISTSQPPSTYSVEHESILNTTNLNPTSTSEHYGSNSESIQSSSNDTRHFNNEDHESSSFNHYLLYESNLERASQTFTGTEETMKNIINNRTET